MRKLYEKSEITFAIAWIVLYMLGSSIANPLSERMGVEKSAHAIFTVALTIALFLWIKRNGLMKKYGLCRTSVPASRFLWYVPLVAISSHNLWNGAAINFPLVDMISYIVYMLCVGFLEEVLFRGLLFRALEKDSLKTAIVISSVTFGLGHLVHLINGSGVDLVENIVQVIGAVAIGFLFVTLFHRGGSLIPCIAAHAAIDVASAFNNNGALSQNQQILICAIEIVLVVAYTLVLLRTLPKKPEAAAGDGARASAEQA